MDLPSRICNRLHISTCASGRRSSGTSTASGDNCLLAALTTKKLPILSVIILAFIISPVPSIADAATLKLVEALTTTWLREVEELESSCQLGRKINEEALSFWNPYLANTRVKAFSEDTEELKQYVDSTDQLKDKDTISAFADAKEAGLLRAMRKRCPGVW